MPRRHGSMGVVSIDPSGGSTYAVVASLNSWTLDQTREKADVTAFGDTVHVYCVGLPDAKGSFGGWYDETTTHNAIFKIAATPTPVGLKLQPTSLAATYFISGPAYLDASIDVKADGAITIAGDWVAAGPMVWAPAFT